MCMSWGNFIPEGLTFMLVLAIFSSVLGMVQFGYNTGVMNTPEDVFRSFLNQSYYHRFGNELSKDGMDLLWSTTVSIFAIGGMLGGLGGFVADIFGRKCGLLLNNVFAIIGATLLTSSKHFNSFECLILGRFLIGLNCGLNTSLVPMYISEISPINLRGSLGTMTQLGVTIGLLLSQIFGLPNVLGTQAHWPTLLGIAFVPAILQLATLPFSAESPRYLYFNDRKAEAKLALQKFRCRKNVDEDLEEMKLEQQSKNEKTMTIIQLLTNSSLRMPLIIAVVMQLSQQLSGINAIFYYSTDVFIKAGVNESIAKPATTAVGLTMVVMTIVSVPLMDRAGRRTLHLVGLGGMFLSSIWLTISLITRFFHESMSLVSVISSLLFVMFFALGPGSIPWLITAELFSQGPRPAAISIAVLVNWSTNFAVGLVFPIIHRVLESYTFMPFSAFLAIFWTFTYYRLPETKNRSFDEIAHLFKISNDYRSNEDHQLEENSDHQSACEETMSNGLKKTGVNIGVPFTSQPGFHIHHFHQPVMLPARFTNYNCLDLNNRTDIHHHPLASSHAILPTHTMIPSQTIIPAHSLPIATSQQPAFLMTGLQPSSLASVKPNLHHGHRHRVKQKRYIAEIDEECLMTNHLIEDQL